MDTNQDTNYSREETPKEKDHPVQIAQYDEPRSQRDQLIESQSAAYKSQIQHERKRSQAPAVVEEMKAEDESSVHTSSRVTANVSRQNSSRNSRRPSANHSYERGHTKA